jgi:hypothetical protein
LTRRLDEALRLALVRQQDLDWHEARLVADGFNKDALLWRQQELRGSK